MKLFNDQATAAVASLDSADAAYCAKLEQRFAHMGINSKAASSAVQSLVEADAVLDVVHAGNHRVLDAPGVLSMAAGLFGRFAAWCHFFVGPVLPRLHLPHAPWRAESPTLKPCRLPISHPGQPRFSPNAKRPRQSRRGRFK